MHYKNHNGVWWYLIKLAAPALLIDYRNNNAHDHFAFNMQNCVVLVIIHFELVSNSTIVLTFIHMCKYLNELGVLTVRQSARAVFTELNAGGLLQQLTTCF